MKKDKIHKLLLFCGFIIAFLCCLYVTDFSFATLQKRGYRFFEFIGKMFPPEKEYLPSVIEPVSATIRMSVAGTVIGSFLALFTSFLSARNLISNRFITSIMKVIIQCIRTIPVLILALMCTFVFGIGTFAGTVALIIYTWAVMTRIGSEDLEALSLHAYEAVANAGCSKLKAFTRTILVELMPGYLTNALYLLETNVRHASILGYVGAGGIGNLLSEKISWREYGKVGMILVLLYLVVLLIEFCSWVLLNYLHGNWKHTRRRNILLTIVLTVVMGYSIGSVGTPDMTALGIKVVGSIFYGIFHPDMGYLFSFASDGVLVLLLQTIAISFAGTRIGAVVAFVLSFLNSSLLPSVISLPVKLFIMAIRTIPVFIYGLMFIRVTGPGSFAGVLTLSLCSIGLICKRFTVAINEMNLSSYEAYQAMGIGWLKRIRYCILPELWPQFLSIVFYRFDVNLRSASVLGLVGAGGIGAPLIMYMNNYRWDAVGSILIGLIVIILVIEFLSAFIRKHAYLS